MSDMSREVFDAITTHIAMVCHNVNKAYCEALGDHSQPTWEDAPDWAKQSALSGVVFHTMNPGASPGASHEEWLKFKEKEGWTWGPVKDPDKKEHPCMVPFDKLPLQQQVKDHLFIAVVNSIWDATKKVPSLQ